MTILVLVTCDIPFTSTKSTLIDSFSFLYLSKHGSQINKINVTILALLVYKGSHHADNDCYYKTNFILPLLYLGTKTVIMELVGFSQL